MPEGDHPAVDPAAISRALAGAPKRLRRGRLRVRISDERGRHVRADGLGPWLARVAPARARGSVSVALVGDGRVRALNRLYRREDYATDVLSFPAFARTQNARATARQAPASARTQNARATARQARREPSARTTEPSARTAEPSALIPQPFLGDIVIARGVARRQAREAGHSERTELRILALHGLLHLLGYDHERDHGRMLRVERRLRRKGGLREGLIERAHPSSLRQAQARPEHRRGTTRSGRAPR